jgi:hypothetical protein
MGTNQLSGLLGGIWTSHTTHALLYVPAISDSRHTCLKCFPHLVLVSLLPPLYSTHCFLPSPPPARLPNFGAATLVFGGPWQDGQEAVGGLQQVQD